VKYTTGIRRGKGGKILFPFVPCFCLRGSAGAGRGGLLGGGKGGGGKGGRKRRVDYTIFLLSTSSLFNLVQGHTLISGGGRKGGGKGG